MDGEAPAPVAPQPTPAAAPEAPSRPVKVSRRGAPVRVESAAAEAPAPAASPKRATPEVEVTVESRQRSINPFNISTLVAQAANKMGVDLSGPIESIGAPKAEPSTPPPAEEAPDAPEAPQEPPPAAATEAQPAKQPEESEQDYRVRLEVRKRVRDFERRDREAARATAEARRAEQAYIQRMQAIERGDFAGAGLNPEQMVRSMLGAPDQPTPEQQRDARLEQLERADAERRAREFDHQTLVEASRVAREQVGPYVNPDSAELLIKQYGSTDAVAGFVLTQMNAYFHATGGQHYPGGVPAAVAALEKMRADEIDRALEIARGSKRYADKIAPAKPTPPPAITNRMAPAPGATTTQAEHTRRTSSGTILRGDAAMTWSERVAAAYRKHGIQR